jgi:hypothetical protein
LRIVKVPAPAARRLANIVVRRIRAIIPRAAMPVVIVAT